MKDVDIDKIIEELTPFHLMLSAALMALIDKVSAMQGTSDEEKIASAADVCSGSFVVAATFAGKLFAIGSGPVKDEYREEFIKKCCEKFHHDVLEQALKSLKENRERVGCPTT